MNFILNTIFLISTIIRFMSRNPNPYSIPPLDDLFELKILPTHGFLLALSLKGTTRITIVEETKNKITKRPQPQPMPVEFIMSI